MRTTKNLSNRSHLWVMKCHELSDIHATSLWCWIGMFFWGSSYIYMFSVWMSRVWHQPKLYITLCTIIHGKSFKITLYLLLFLEPGKLMTLVWRDGNGGWGKPHKSTDKTSYSLQVVPWKEVFVLPNTSWEGFPGVPSTSLSGTYVKVFGRPGWLFLKRATDRNGVS